MTSKPTTRSQTQDNELVGTTLDQREPMTTDAPDVGHCPHEFHNNQSELNQLIKIDSHSFILRYAYFQFPVKQ